MSWVRWLTAVVRSRLHALLFYLKNQEARGIKRQGVSQDRRRTGALLQCARPPVLCAWRAYNADTVLAGGHQQRDSQRQCEFGIGCHHRTRDLGSLHAHIVQTSTVAVRQHDS